MSVAKALRPKYPANLKLTLLGAGALFLVYLLAAWLAPWSPKSAAGLAFGTLAALLFFFDMAYPARRPRATPLRSARHWLQAHVYLGSLAFLAVLMHTGFELPHGWFGWALLLLSFWTTFTGLVGVFLQKWIPSTLADNLSVEALFERIPELVAKLREEADHLMDGASDQLDHFYRSKIREPLSRLDPSWNYLLDVRGGRERALEPFRQIAPFVEASEKDKVQDLMSLYTEKLELDAQYRMQWLLRRWLALTGHVLAAGLLVGLLVVHVLTWVLY